jgi:hypothetical protein
VATLTSALSSGPRLDARSAYPSLPSGNGLTNRRIAELASVLTPSSHDLRHAGNTYTADAGANNRELMERMGHFTARGEIYLHSTDERQHALTDAVEKAARAGLCEARRKAVKIAQCAKHRYKAGTDVARDGGQESYR